MSTRKRTTTGSGFLGTLEELPVQEEKITGEVLAVEETPEAEEAAPAEEEVIKPEVTPEPPKLAEKPKPEKVKQAPKPVSIHVNPEPNKPVGVNLSRRNIPRFVR